MFVVTSSSAPKINKGLNLSSSFKEDPYLEFKKVIVVRCVFTLHGEASSLEVIEAETTFSMLISS